LLLSLGMKCTLTETLALLLIALKFISVMMRSDEFEIKLNQFGGLIILRPEMLPPCKPSVPKRIGRATD
jgi:hypothetical protein